ncbi:MAG: pyridoxal-phosphate dependent enzyme [Kordiimonadaceae bacterium]|nr:pyridoxal-phosphate dependent enzyme [Kordiimonadaceae bacterium]MBO6568946.1 pyridoxal-phosphate dependent enzyme [Kordiimonadaceae bacterium]MBO6965079.1 pyridoxal-phosphate dependent enzyme [Kordiimonadaceae bacterium]
MSKLSPTQVAKSAQNAHERIKDRIIHTPLFPSRQNPDFLFFKADNFQRTGSFKIRGAMNKLSKAMANGEGTSTRFITASSGNHGIGAATAAVDLGADLTVVLPENVAPLKLERIKAIGANVVVAGAEAGASEMEAQKLADSEGYVYISPYNDPDIIAGQGTIGVELLDDFGGGQIDNIFISLGGGGLVSGIASVLKIANSKTKVWGVSAKNSAALDASIKAGRVVETEHLPTVADAVAGGIDETTVTLPLACETVDHLLQCTEEEIEACMGELAFDEGMVVEGSAALALAGYHQVASTIEGETSVVLLCGGNISREQVQQILSKEE